MIGIIGVEILNESSNLIDNTFQIINNDDLLFENIEKFLINILFINNYFEKLQLEIEKFWNKIEKRINNLNNILIGRRIE